MEHAPNPKLDSQGYPARGFQCPCGFTTDSVDEINAHVRGSRGAARADDAKYMIEGTAAGESVSFGPFESRAEAMAVYVALAGRENITALRLIRE